jgi:hypothetical protein
MQVQLDYSWQQAKRTNFNADKIRREAKRFVVSKEVKERRVLVRYEHGANDVQEWLADNDIGTKEYQMYGVFDDRPNDKMYYVGLSFVFEDPMTAMYFKLRFC